MRSLETQHSIGASFLNGIVGPRFNRLSISYGGRSTVTAQAQVCTGPEDITCSVVIGHRTCLMRVWLFHDIDHGPLWQHTTRSVDVVQIMWVQLVLTTCTAQRQGQQQGRKIILAISRALPQPTVLHVISFHPRFT